MQRFNLLLVFLCFITIYVTANLDISEEDKAKIDEKLRAFSTLLSANHQHIQSNVKNLGDYIRCSYPVACPADTEDWPGAVYPVTGMSPDPQFQNISVNPNQVVTKIRTGTEPAQKHINEICLIESQKEIWRDNLALENVTDGLVWQYYGGESMVSVFHPAFEWQSVSECPTDLGSDYDPVRRPWYVSDASGQKNVVILLDLSDTHTDAGVRIAQMKHSLLQLVGTLSYRDYVGLVTYTEFTKPYFPNMVRATVQNIRALKLYAQSLQVASGTKSNLGNAFKTGYTMLQNSINNGDGEYLILCSVST